jgi:ubiquinone/menaquinone biosynthesis C-methylase UbiE
MIEDKSRSQALATFSAEMKRDWDDRARENAKWYINTLSTGQTEDEFELTGRQDYQGLVHSDIALLTDRRDPRNLRVLEIGCGIGRMTRYLAENFGEVYGIDVSGEMIHRAKERLGDIPNIHFQETSGLDFAVFPDEYFDIIFSAYVFQHIPSPQVIESNIRDAFRVLKPRGVFKFVTSGIKHDDYLQMHKDTWSGAPFPENEIRRLAKEIGAQLLGIVGDGTQYCWTHLRKRGQTLNGSSASRTSPKIKAVRRSDNRSDPESSPRVGDMYLEIILHGINYETLDINNLMVEFRGRSFIPCYVGPVGIDSEDFIKNKDTYSNDYDRVQVNLRIPADEPGGDIDLIVRLSVDVASKPVKITLPPAQPEQPRIVAVTNAVDTGLDVYAQGPKSRIKIFVDRPGKHVEIEDIKILLGNYRIKTETIFFLPGNNFWEITAQLPEDTLPGEASLRVEIGGVPSTPFVINLKTWSDD